MYTKRDIVCVNTLQLAADIKICLIIRELILCFLRTSLQVYVANANFNEL